MCAQQPEQCSIVGRGGFWLESGAERAGICRADDLMAVVSSQSKQALTVQGKGDLLDHSHCRGVSKPAHGRSEQTAKKQKERQRRKEEEEKLAEQFTAELEIIFFRRKWLQFSRLVCSLSSPSSYHLVSLSVALSIQYIHTYCTRSGLMKPSQCLCDPFKKAISII